MFNALELSEKPLSDLKEIIKDLGAKPNGTKKPDLILQIIALQGTAGLWSTKVLRAGMGAHFSLQLIESASVEDVRRLQVPLLCTSSHQGEYLHDLQLTRRIPAPCAWVFGHEGQGVRDELLGMATQSVKIAQPSGEESLNVAAATAICLYAGISQHQK